MPIEPKSNRTEKLKNILQLLVIRKKSKMVEIPNKNTVFSLMDKDTLYRPGSWQNIALPGNTVLGAILNGLVDTILRIFVPFNHLHHPGGWIIEKYLRGNFNTTFALATSAKVNGRIFFH
jgi:hypothetical protein